METTTKLVYKSDFEKNAYSLVELNTPELVEEFDIGKSIVIKGLPEDEAVLCTESKTYIVRQVNTSNSIVLVDRNERQGCHYVHGDISNTIELLPCLARIGRLDDLLCDSSYSGQENEEYIRKENKTLYTLNYLLSIVQASKQELLDGLEQRGAFLHEGYYRLFDKDYLFRLFDSLMTNSTIRGIKTDKMMEKEAENCILEEMRKQEGNEELEIPTNVLKACIHYFTTTTTTWLQFDTAKVCRFLGEWILTNPRGKRWKMEEFMESWSDMGYNFFKPELQHLSGLYITTETTRIGITEQYIEYFPIHELSTDPPQRFATLFAEKPLWSGQDIYPFLQDLAPSQKQKETLLLKFARIHKSNNSSSILYGSRIK